MQKTYITEPDGVANLFSQTQHPDVLPVVSGLRDALDDSQFTAFRNQMDLGYMDPPASYHHSRRSLASISIFMNRQYNHRDHRIALDYLLQETGKGSPTSIYSGIQLDKLYLLATLLIGNKNIEARSALKEHLDDHMKAWATTMRPDELENAGQSRGGMGLPVQNEVALLMEELDYNYKTGTNDYRFMHTLMESAAIGGGRVITGETYNNGVQTPYRIDCGPEAIKKSLLACRCISPDAVNRYFDSAIPESVDLEPGIGLRVLKSSPIQVQIGWLQEQLTAQIRMIAEGPVPGALISTDDFDDQLLGQVFGIARLMEEIRNLQWKAVEGWKGASHNLVTDLFEGRLACFVAQQPTTRTQFAIQHSMRMLGIVVDELSANGSSRAKGESPISELFTFEACGIDVLFERSNTMEQDAAVRLQAPGINAPVMVNLGGDLHHPTQTLSDILCLMDIFGRTGRSLEELRERTSQATPCIAFYSRMAQKRADHQLLNFVKDRLGWKTLLIAPYEEDVPQNNPRIDHIIIHPDRLDQAGLLRTLRSHDATILYMSNAEATAATTQKGTGQGKREPASLLMLDTLMQAGTYLMHPLPESGELDPHIFAQPHFLGQRQITNKVFLIAAATSAMLAKRLTQTQNY